MNAKRPSKGGAGLSLGLIFVIAAFLLVKWPWFSSHVDDLTTKIGQIGASPAQTAHRPATGTATTLTMKAGPSSTPKTTVPTAGHTALAQLNSLKVLATRPNPTGYQRSCSPGQACSFGPAWTDDTSAPDSHNGCDTRNDLMREQLEAATVKYVSGSRCLVASGVLHDPYTGKEISFVRGPDSAVIQADHLAPLRYVWDIGANDWTQAQRNTYANDTQMVLIMASGPANGQKSDAGPGEWMPPNKAYWCTYDSRFVTVLITYHLPIVQSDKTAMAKVLANCP